MKKSLFSASAMRFAVCYKHCGQMKAIACACTVGVAKEIAEWMSKTMLKDSATLTGQPKPVLYVFDCEGHCYGSYE